MEPPALPYPEIVLPRLRFQYCPMCAARLIRAADPEDGIERPKCPACGWVHYPANAIGVCVVIRSGDQIVALLPPGSPADAPAALPAGHCEYGESPEQAAVREAREETGLEVEITRALGWYFQHRADYPGPNVSFMFEARVTGGELRPGSEGRAAFYPIEAFPRIDPNRRGSMYTLDTYRALLRGGGTAEPQG